MRCDQVQWTLDMNTKANCIVFTSLKLMPGHHNHIVLLLLLLLRIQLIHFLFVRTRNRIQHQQSMILKMNMPTKNISHYAMPIRWWIVTMTYWVRLHRNHGISSEAEAIRRGRKNHGKHINELPNYSRPKIHGAIVSPINWCLSHRITIKSKYRVKSRRFYCSMASVRGTLNRAAMYSRISNARWIRAKWRPIVIGPVEPISFYTKTTTYRPMWHDRQSNFTCCISSSVRITHNSSKFPMYSIGHRPTGKCYAMHRCVIQFWCFSFVTFFLAEETVQSLHLTRNGNITIHASNKWNKIGIMHWIKRKRSLGSYRIVVHEMVDYNSHTICKSTSR